MPNYDMMSWIWLGAVVLFGIIEAATSELVSIWFVAGALGAFLLALFSAPLWAQIAVFLALSVATLLLVRPIAKRKLQPAIIPTNADRVIGAVGTVAEGAEPGELARVAVDGQNWAALCPDALEKGDKVRITAIEGVKLITEKL